MLTLAFAPGAGGSAPAQNGRHVHTWHDDRGRETGRAFAGDGGWWIDWPSLGIFAFERGSPHVRVWPASGVSRDLLRERFDRMVQPVILQALGWQTLHAAAVAGGGGVIAFCGRRGDGKSTLAYALARAGWTQTADDAVVLSVGAGGVLAHPLPFAPKLRPPARRHFGSSPPAGRAARQPGAAAMPLAAVYALGGSGESRVCLERLAPQRAFAALLPHAYSLDAADRAETQRLVEDYLTVAARVPVFSLAYPRDFTRLPEVVDAVVAGLAEAGTVHAPAAEVPAC